MGGGEEDESFLSLEDDEPKAKQPSARPAPQPIVIAEAVEEAVEEEVVDSTVLADAAGSYAVSWPILGMDCPDCAAKANRAMKQMKQVSNSMVSVASGEVKLDVDLEVGPLFEVSSVLRSLGHAPDVEHHELVGVRASSVAQRNDVPVARLNRVIRRQPGVLDVEIMDDDRILLQMVVTNDENLLKARSNGLRNVIGREPVFTKAKSDRLRPDQWRLIGGGIAFPVLVFVLMAETMGFGGVLIPPLAVLGVAVGGVQMFKEAFGSLRTLQMG